MNSRLILATIVLIALLIGGNFSVLKFALDHSTPLLIAGMRTVIGSSVLLAFALLRGRAFSSRPSGPRQHLRGFAEHHNHLQRTAGDGGQSGSPPVSHR